MPQLRPLLPASPNAGCQPRTTPTGSGRTPGTPRSRGRRRTPRPARRARLPLRAADPSVSGAVRSTSSAPVELDRRLVARDGRERQGEGEERQRERERDDSPGQGVMRRSSVWPWVAKRPSSETTPVTTSSSRRSSVSRFSTNVPGSATRPEKREGRDACSPAVPVTLEAAVDDERPVLFGSRIDELERNLALLAHPPQVRQEWRRRPR